MLRSTLRQLARRLSRRPSPARKALRARPSLEGLEFRVAPAVTVSIVGGVLTAQGDSGSNTVTVDHSSSGFAVINGQSFSDASYNSIQINGGVETDTTILGNVKPLTVATGSNLDNAVVENLPGILGTLSIGSVNQPFRGDVIIQDKGDNTNDANVLLTASSLTGLSPAAINFNSSNSLEELLITGGDGNNTYTVAGTPVSRVTQGGRVPTVLGTGNGDDTVNILATTDNAGATALTVTTGGRGNDVVNVGNGTLTGIQGIVEIDGTASSAHVNVNDGADTTNHSNVMVSNTGVLGLSPAVITFLPSALHGLTITGGDGNNTWNLANIASTGGNPTVLNTGTGHDIVNVLDTVASDPVTVNTGNSSNNDVVNVGSSSTLSGEILGTVTINDGHGGSKVTIDDSLDPAFHTNVILTASSLTGLSPAAINFGPNALAGLTISGNFRDTTYTVVNTPSSGVAGGNPTVLNTGNAVDTVNVLGTAATAPLTVSTGSGTASNGSRGNDVVNVGNGGTLAGINGTLTLINGVEFFPSSAHVNINDGADNANHPNVLLTTFFDPLIFPVDSSLTGLSPAPIKFENISVKPLTITVGNGHNTYTVNETEVVGFPVVLNTGNGNDTVNVQGIGIAGPLTVNAGTGQDTINVGSAANTLDHIQSAVTVNGGPGGDTLNINDQGSTTPHSYNQTLTTLARSGAALITFNGVTNVQVHKGAVLGPMLTHLAFPRSIKAGQFATLKGRLVDPDHGARRTLLVDWGDGSQPKQVMPHREPFTLRHHYQKAGSDTAHLVWSDSKGLSNSLDLSLTVTKAK